MTHTVCGSPVVMKRVTFEGFEPELVEMVPYCPTCAVYIATVKELGPDRVSPGRPWEVDEE